MKNLIYFFTAITIVLSSCQKEPTACFTASKTDPAAGEEILLANCTEDAESYEWNFGDGTQSLEENPKHTYFQSGTYTVQLKGLSKNGKKTDVINLNIIVACGTGYEGANCDPWSDEFLGNYNGDDTCGFLFTSTITAASDNVLDISNFVGLAASATANVTSIDGIDIPTQTVNGYVVSGDGVLNGSTLRIDYKIDGSDCQVDYTK